MWRSRCVPIAPSLANCGSINSGAATCRDMPWRPGEDWRPWSDVDDIALAEQLQLLGLPMKKSTVADAVAMIAGEYPHHPVAAWLDELAWDGTKRLDGWLTTYLGVTDTAYSRAVASATLVAAVARIRRPGCKADHVLILEGPQGAGKSQAVAALAPNPDWFTDEIADLGTKDAAQGLRGKWIIELPELSAMRRGEIETIKAFTSRATDHYRPSYGRRAEDFPRQCIFIGSTNGDAYLADDTGNRRFWPVKVGNIDLNSLRRDREQLWAEAVAAFAKDTCWWLTQAEEALAREEQAERHPEDPWSGSVLAWAETHDKFVIEDFLASKADGLGMAEEDISAPVFRRVASILRGEGWERGDQKRINGKRRRPYQRPSPMSPIENAMGDTMGDTNGTKSINDYSASVTHVTHNTGRTHDDAHTHVSGNRGRMGDMGDTLPETRSSSWHSRPSPIQGNTGGASGMGDALLADEAEITARGELR